MPGLGRYRATAAIRVLIMEWAVLWETDPVITEAPVIGVERTIDEFGSSGALGCGRLTKPGLGRYRATAPIRVLNMEWAVMWHTDTVITEARVRGVDRKSDA